MKWFAVLVVILIVGAGAWYYKETADMERRVGECASSQAELQRFLRALAVNDASQCGSLGEPLKSRCSAMISSDPSVCSLDDFDCVAMAGKNISLCAEAVCRAWVSQDFSYCDGLGSNVEWCRNLVSLNAEYFAPSEQRCREVVSAAD